MGAGCGELAIVSRQLLAVQSALPHSLTARDRVSSQHLYICVFVFKLQFLIFEELGIVQV